MLKSSELNIELWGTPGIVLLHTLKLLFTRTRCRLFVKLLFRKKVHLFENHILLTWQSWFIVSKAFDNYMNIAQTKPLLSRVFFHLPSILIKQCWVLWFFLNPVSRFDNLSSMKLWVYMILLKTFDMWGETLTGL